MKYFAYGSNMLNRRLTHPSRAPSAIPTGVAKLRGFVVRYHKVGMDGSGKCTLKVIGDEDATAYGVLFEIDVADGKALDRVEGVQGGGYCQRFVRVQLVDRREVTAMTYVATKEYLDTTQIPFDWYRDLVVAGAAEHDLPKSYIKEYLQVRAQPDPDVARARFARQLLQDSQFAVK